MAQVDRINGLSGNVATKVPCRVATTVNITLSGLQTVDGVALAEGDRVLVKNQTAASENGIYDASALAWVRSPDFDGDRDVVQGTFVVVTSGTQNNQYFRVATADPIVIGTSSITFTSTVGALTGTLAQFSATTSLELAGVMTDETGTGSLVFANSPTLVTPNLGTPSALVGTNITGTAAGLSIGGNAATATAVTVSDAAADTSTWVMLAGSQTGDQTPLTDSAIGFNASTNTLAVTTGGAGNAFVGGSVSGIAVYGNSSSGYGGYFNSASGTGLYFSSSTTPGQITSTLADGTAPFVITSTTPVANLSIGGNAATATTATTTTNITLGTTADTSTWVVITESAGGDMPPKTDGQLTYNASTGQLNATTFNGALIGNVTGNVSGSSGSCTGNAATATNVTTNANLTGHVTSVGNAAVLGSFTLAQLNTAVSDANLGADVQEFVADGTWTKPAGCAFVMVEIISAGGGGGSGRRGNNNTNRSGGRGGGGGGYKQCLYAATSLGATEVVVVGAGGTGGAAQTADNTDGNSGVNGGNTSFGSVMISVGGKLGAAGNTASGAGGNGGYAGGAGQPAVNTQVFGEIGGGVSSTGSGGSAYCGGGGGGANSLVSSGYLGGKSAYGGGGGGPGASIASTESIYAGGAGGGIFGSGASSSGVGEGGAAGTGGGSGSDGASNVEYRLGGQGGGGGSTLLAAIAGNGGNGGAYGGGGGGGGASSNGFNSGAGGAGGNGYVRVTSW